MALGVVAALEKRNGEIEIPCIVGRILRVVAVRGTVHGDSEENTGATWFTLLGPKNIPNYGKISFRQV